MKQKTKKEIIQAIDDAIDILLNTLTLILLAMIFSLAGFYITEKITSIGIKALVMGLLFYFYSIMAFPFFIYTERIINKKENKKKC